MQTLNQRLSSLTFYGVLNPLFRSKLLPEKIYYFKPRLILQVAEQLKNTPEIPQKTSKNRFPLYFVWDKKPTKKPKNFRPGPELKTVFIALEMKFAMIFFSPGPRTGNSIYNFGNKFAMYSLGNMTLSSRTSFPKL